MISSTSIPQKYDVYLSCSPEDGRNNFVSHLYDALLREGITTYIYDKRLEIGDGISFGIRKAIDESKLRVIIFSKNYASSPRCLDELVHILECKGKGKVVVPVFYDLHPSDLSRLKGCSGTTFTIAQEHFKDNIQDKVDQWKRALEESSSLSGWSSFDTRSDIEFVQKIVEDVLNKLHRMSSNVEDVLKKLHRMSSNDYSEFLVGIDERIEEIESLLRIGSPDAVHTVGIVGGGGIGKTTLAHEIYNKLSSQFKSCYFLSNVKDESNRHGLIELQHKLLAELLGKTNKDLSNPSFGRSTLSREKLRCRKVLLVLDDVNNSNQFKLLASEKDLFSHGSRIIVTTRDIQVLKNIGADIYQVAELNFQEALQLFHSTCFRKASPTKNYRELSKQIVEYANGNPLALKIMGSSLFGKGIEAWEDTLTKLKKAPKVEVAKMLKISYDALDSNQQNVFLDIACFFRGMKRDFVECILAPSLTTDAIDDLIAKSLITLGRSNELQMHDLVQEMGHEIVKQESFMHPGNRSRLCSAEDVCKVLKDDMGTAAIKGISLDMSNIEEEVLHLQPTSFKEMTNLRLLKIYYSSTSTPEIKYTPQALHYHPHELSYLHWEHYPLTSLPQYFSPKTLVGLNMPYSKLEKLWDGVQDLQNLKSIDLSYSSNLIRLPDLSRAQLLEFLNLKNCRRLSYIPSNFYHLKKLITLNLNGCSSLHKFPELPLSIEQLSLGETSIEYVPSSIGSLSSLMTLELHDCKSLKSIPTSICKLESLKCLNMSGCSKLEYFPEISETMEPMRFLSLQGTGIRELPPSVKNLAGLLELDLTSCENLKSLPSSLYSLSKLEILIISDCKNLEALPGPGQSSCLTSLSQLDLSSCGIFKVPEELVILSSIESLDLSGNKNIEGIPTSIKQLSRLKTLNISNCENLRSLTEIPLSLEFIDAHGCTSLKTVSSSKSVLTQGPDHLDGYSEKLVFFNCLKLDQNALSNLIIDSQLRILRMATVSRNKSKHVLECPSVSICYPGNKIPKWFSYQTAGSYINIKLPPHWRNTNFLGFALCIVAAPFKEYNFHPPIHFHCESHFRSKDGRRQTLKLLLRGYGQENADEDKTRIFLNSDHVFQWYDYGLYHHGLEDTCTEVSFEFYPTDSLDEQVNVCRVKKCGVHILYLQEAAKFDFIDRYLVRESKGAEISTIWNATDPISESETSDRNSGIKELLEEEEEDTIRSEAESSPGGDVDHSDIGDEGDDNQHPEVIYKKEINSCGCFLFLSKIKEFWDYVLVKNSGHDRGPSYRLRQELSTSPGTTSLPVAIEQHLQALEETLSHMHSQIMELQNQNEYLKRTKWAL